MALPLETVVKQLADSGIVAPGKLENFIPPNAHPKTAEELVAELVKAGNLTPFQAQQVKAGKAKALILGNYTIGMGQVFKAEHRRLKRVIALKMLPPVVTKDAVAVARFQREVEAAARLRHPNIVATDDADQAGAVHFLVMEYIEGKDLSAMVKRDGPFPVSKAVDYILQTARGLEFAHSEGVVHRDIKPANLLLDKKGTVKILDMGLARIESDGPAQTELTGTGTIMGTVDYMSPEQALNTKNADHRADIYSLGMSLYYLLMGKAAYGGETAMEKLMAHQTQPIPSLSDAHAEVPEQVEAVFKKMVAKKIENRYQSMSDVVADLQTCQAALSASATSITGVWKPATTTDDSSEMSLLMQNQKLKRISDDPFAIEEPPKKPKKEKQGPRKKAAAGVPPWKSPKVLIGAGAAGFLAVLLGVIVIFRNDKGEEVGHIELPPGVTAEVHPTKPAPVVAATAQPAAPPKPLVAPFDANAAHTGQETWAKYLNTTVEQKNAGGMTLVLIPPGEFLMGSTPEENALGVKMAQDAKLKPEDGAWQRLKEEGPQHRVTIIKPYWLGLTEVTIGQFKKFVEATKYVTDAEQFGFGESGATKADDKITAEQKKRNWRTPGYAVTDDSPVTQITWNDCIVFCNWLSDQEKLKPCYRQDAKSGWIVLASGTGYRLPTEAEWEYACRAGTTTQFSFGDDPAMLDIYGWFKKNSGGSARAVGLKVANGFGLFDMHGNVYEWCQDFYAADYYSKSSPSDPTGPSSSSHRVLRGGSWNNYPANCRSAFRSNYAPVNRYDNVGFRMVRVTTSATTPEAGLATTATTPPAVSAVERAVSNSPLAPGGRGAAKPWESPAFQQWVKDVQAMPAEKQLEAFSKKLMELNPGFDGKVTPGIEKGKVTGQTFLTGNVTDISPVKALVGLKHLTCSGYPGKSKFADLSPLQGMTLERFGCPHSSVFDLSPLKGMPLIELVLSATDVSDLSPLAGMPLTNLNCQVSPVADLSPLRGMPLTQIICGTKVSDLSPLQGMSLTSILLLPQNITKGIEVIRQMKSLKVIGVDGNNKWPAAEFWKKYDAGEFGKPGAAPSPQPSPARGEGARAWESPAFQQWVKEVQALPAEKQVEAVSKKLVELNPEFDGKLTDENRKGTPRIAGGVVTGLGFLTDKVLDISPVRALAGLQRLGCSTTYRRGWLADVGPLAGMQLTHLGFGDTQVANLSPLVAMPLADLYCPMTKVSDLSPLYDCRSLKRLHVEKTEVTAAGVAALQKALPNCKIDWDGAEKPAVGFGASAQPSGGGTSASSVESQPAAGTSKTAPSPQPSPVKGEGAKTVPAGTK